ncbi:MAG TPA: LptF/LptG family permease [Bacteroidales bacterium]|nr:LptF/LptG family permease [Bacteroidales bacterium]HOL97013.1 LptF/LptG family permease [Bacteroidales bacterium]HPD23806.1 LptF/LptG family permease [Bacteroidales bacterium]HRS98698.1 LptF/LptG family permease [Bacteroidales bacterium]HUM31402.1 LptF/LptG family permease [Bacteroidales bacterium]
MNVLKKLHIYIVKKFIGPLLLTFLICVFILLMQFLWKYIDDLVGKGLDWDIIARLLFYASLTLVPLALPLAVLLASIMTFGNLGERNELFAMKAGGVSLYRIMFPLLIFNIIISVGAFYFSNNLLPYTNLKMRTLLFSIQQQRPEVLLRNGIFTDPVDNISIKIDRKYRNNNMLEGIMIYDHRNRGGNTNVTTAETGNIYMTEDKSVLILDLYNGYRYEEIKKEEDLRSLEKSRPHQTSKFDRQVVYIPLDVIEINKANEDLFKNSFDMLNVNQLKYATDSLNNALLIRKKEIWNNIILYSLFKAENKWVNIPDEIKTIAQQNVGTYGDSNKKIMHVDSVFYNLNEMQKSKVLDFALNFANSAKTYVEVSIDEINGYQQWIARHKVEWHRKYVLSIACLLFFLLGAPLGSIIRKGGFGLPVIVAVLIFLLYYIVSITFEKTVRQAVMSPEIGMWISTYVLIPLAIFLIYKAATDSMRVSSHFYEKINNFFRRKKRKYQIDSQR